jgi:uncharacterized membrane protein HdeD (DUF308 family)
LVNRFWGPRSSFRARSWAERFRSLERSGQAAARTLVIAALLVVGGVHRIVAAVALQYRYWGWLLANGVITMFLGLLIWAKWTSDSFWVIGTFMGIELIFNGWTWVMFGLALCQLPKPVAS